MGSICPCFFRAKKQQTKAFEISESISDLSSVKQRGFEQFNQESNEETTDGKESELSSIKKTEGQEQGQSLMHSIIPMKIGSENKGEQLNDPHPEIYTIQELPKHHPIEEPQPKPQPPPAKKPNRYQKNVNLDDYRFINLTSQLKVKKPNTLNSQQFNINSCTDCQIYIFDVTANVYVDKCHNCFIFCAPCQSTIFIRDSTNIKMIGATKQFRVRDCTDLQISLYCNSQPVIESSSNVEFSNFGTFGYRQLYDQFKKAKMSVFNNHWSEIHDFTKKETLNYKLVVKKDIECSWKQGLEQAGLEYSSPLIPSTMDQPEEQYRLAVVNSPNQQQQEEIAFRFVKDGIVIFKSFRGRVDGGVHNRFQQIFNNQENDYLCLKVSVEVAESLREEFEIMEDEDKALEAAIFPTFKDEH